MDRYLDEAVRQVQRVVTRLDLKQARVRRVGTNTVVYVPNPSGTPFAEVNHASGVTAGATATVPRPPVTTFEIVQSAVGFSGFAESTIDVVLPDAPTEGNLLILWYVHRSADPPGPDGWTQHPDGFVRPSGPGEAGAMYWHRVGAGESATITWDTVPNVGRAFMVEVAGVGDSVLDAASLTMQAANATMTLDLSPTSAALLIMGIVEFGGDPGGDPPEYTPIADTTELDDGWSGGFHPDSFTGYRVVTAGGTYAIGATGIANVWGTEGVAFSSGTEGFWADAPFTIDDDDSTYVFVYGEQEETLRIVLDEPFEIARARLRIGIENAGSVTYDLQAATLADFSDATTVASVTFTATGSYTPQDVAFEWASTGAFQYWQLGGPAENRQIHSFELYEAVLTGITDHGELTGLGDDDHPQYTTDAEAGVIAAAAVTTHTGDTTDAHDAAAVSFDPTASGSPEDDVQGELDRLETLVAAASAATLDDLTDVTIAAVAADDTLQYNGSAWVNTRRRWEPVTFDPGTGPEIVFTPTDIVMTWETY